MDIVASGKANMCICGDGSHSFCTLMYMKDVCGQWRPGAWLLGTWVDMLAVACWFLPVRLIQ